MESKTFPNSHYDVIIVGGRPASATLAARLGQQGLRALLLERAKLPSVPAASSPAIYPATMRLLDEIGADEAEYARGTPRVHWLIIVAWADQLGCELGHCRSRARLAAAPERTLWRWRIRFWPTATTATAASRS